MSTIFKRSGSPFWYYQITDHHGRRTVPKSTKTTDKATAKRIAAKAESDAALRREGVIDPAAERLAKQSGRTLDHHIGEFQTSLESAGKSEGHISATVDAVKAIAARGGWRSLSDVTAEDVESFAASLKRSGEAGRTIQRKINAAKQFAKWANETGRIGANPLIGVKAPSPDTDRRLERRALRPEEWPYLRDAAQEGQTLACGLTGSDRALLYELAIQTGLRAMELRSLTPGRLHLGQTPPFVLVPSRSTKNKQPARQYVTADLAKRLAGHVKGRTPGLPLFDLPSKFDMADMIRDDLAEAREKWIDSQPKRKQKESEQSDFLAVTNHDGQRFDFHALRHTCGSWLAMAGENPKVIQSVMRHSSITLTMDTYGHLFPASESDAIARLGRVHFDC